MYIFDWYFGALIHSVISFYGFMQLVTYIALISKSFHLSEVVYDNTIDPFFGLFEDVIDGYLNQFNSKISKSKEYFVKNTKKHFKKFAKETFLPMLSSFIFNNPQEPENKGAAGEKSDEDATEKPKED